MELMYNADQKMKFIASLKENGEDEVIVQKYIKTFELFEVYEKKLDKDISDFTRSEIMEVYASVGKKVEELKNHHYRLKKYALYNYPQNNDFLLVDSNAIKTLREKVQPITYEQIIQAVASLRNSIDKFILYGLFYGIRGTNYIELGYSSMEDCDKEKCKIWLAKTNAEGGIIRKGREFYADTLLYGFAEDAANTYVYTSVTKGGVYKAYPLNQEKYTIWKKLAKSEKISKYDAMSAGIQMKAKALLDACFVDNKYTLLDVYYSGLYHYAMQLASEQNKEIKTINDIMKLGGLDELIIRYDTNKRNVKNYLDRFI